MKLFYGSLITIIVLMLNAGCRGKGSSHSTNRSANDTTSVSDTGFTGIKKFLSGNHITLEATFKNGIKNGLSKSFYASGKLRATSWYENGLREDSSKWYFEEGQLFRSTPYRHDTIDGIQIQYFRNGKIKARIGYKKGLRTFQFEEFDPDGKKITGYPEMVVHTRDEYTSSGIYRITLGLTDNTASVQFFRGDFEKGVFDSAHSEKIKTINRTGVLDLRKTGKPQTGSIDVLASVLTFYGNRYLEYKKIELPYKDLN